MKTTFQRLYFTKWTSALFVFILYLYISIKTPLAGDDWGYAINGLTYNPFLKAIEFYFTWSGRFFAELYGFLVTPHKWIWNILNPILFTSIFLNIYKIISFDKKKSFISILIIIFLMLSVKDELRMETYTWLMGTTYVIPLALSFYYLNKLHSFFIQNIDFNVFDNIFISIALFVIGLSMENISISFLVFNIIVLIFIKVSKNKINKNILFFTFLSLISFVILRFSPGANLRLLRDHADWISLSLFEQIRFNYSNLIKYTFIENKYLILLLSSILLVTLFQNTKKKNLISIFISIIFMTSLLYPFSLRLQGFFPNFSILAYLNETSIFSYLFWPIYYSSAFYTLFVSFENKQRIIAISLFILASFNNGVMLLSPIFGYRSSIFTVYFLIALVSYLLINLHLNLLIRWLGISSFIILTMYMSYSLKQKYDLVQQVASLRMEQINYYIDHPDVNDAWLIRYPIFSIHSGDIEDWDVYHMEVFKKYYGLEMDTVLHFYFPQDGY